MSRLAFASSSALVVLAWAVPASAHIEMTYPPMRYSQVDIKDPPCGAVGNPPGTNEPTVLQAGEMITITLDEFVDHGGHFRIAFSEDGTDQFVSPTGFDDFYNDPSVLMDDIPDDQVGGVHEIDFVVPNVNCNPCTLQALQVMSGGAFSEDSLYYNCADIVIEGAVEGTTGDDTGVASLTSDSATVTATDASATNGDDNGTGGDDDAEGDTTAALDDNGDDAPAETGESGSGGNSVTLSGATTDTNEDDDEAGCACSARPRPNAVWALPLFVIALARRRR